MTIVIWSVFQFINIMIEGKGAAVVDLSMSDYLYGELYEITIRMVSQSTILFMNNPKLSR